MGLNTKVEIRTRIIDGKIWWLIRDIGRMLGYGSDGGNLSRNINGKWKTHFRLRKLGTRQSATIAKHKTEKGGQAYWATFEGLNVVMERIDEEEPQYSENMREFMSIYHTRPRTKKATNLEDRVLNLEAKVSVLMKRI